MKKILIIEDDVSLAKMYQTKITRDTEFDVVLADNGQKGLELVSKENPDLILLDVVMPHVDGRMVFEELKKTGIIKRIPVVFLTNLGAETENDKKLFSEASGYLVKADSTPTDVVAKVKEVLCIR